MAGRSPCQTPHDILVRYVFDRPEAVAIILRRVLPPALLPFVDFASLAPLPTVEADSLLRSREADLRFSVDLVDGDLRVPLYVPLEHQSTRDALMPCRVHTYTGDLWNRFIRAHPTATSVPAVLPVLLAQHRARNTPRRLTQVLNLTPRLRAVFGQPIELQICIDDLSGSVLDDPVARPGPLALVEITRALLHAHHNPGSFTPERMAILAPQFDILLQHDDPVGKEDIDALWRYVLDVFGRDSPVCPLILESVSKEVRQMYLTIADHLRAEGRAAGLSEGHAAGKAEGHAAGLSEGRAAGKAEGRAIGLSEGRAAGLSEGRAAGKAEALLALLRHRNLPVPATVRTRILATRDESLLRRWFERALALEPPDELLDTYDD